MNDSKRKQLVEIITKMAFKTQSKTIYNNIKDFVINSKVMDNMTFLSYKVYPNRLEFASDVELFKLFSAILKFRKAARDLYSLKDFFTDSEIEIYKNYSGEEFDVKKLYVLNDAYFLGENQYTCRASLEQLALMRKYNIIRIDPSLQRESKERTNRSSDDLIREIYINWNRVEEIEEKIVSQKFSFNSVRINMMNDGELKPVFDEDNHKIIIPENADLVQLDGNHRTIAIERAYSLHPELVDYFRNSFFQVAFTFYNYSKARDCIYQEWNVQPVSKKHRMAFDNSMSNVIIDEIKRSNSAEELYADAICNSSFEAKGFKNKFIFYSDLKITLDDFCNAKSIKLKSDAIDYANWYVKYLNYVTSLIYDKLYDSKYWYNNTYTWCGFLYMGYYFKDDNDWMNKTKNIIFNSGIWNKDKKAKIIKSSKSNPNIKSLINYINQYL